MRRLGLIQVDYKSRLAGSKENSENIGAVRTKMGIANSDLNS